MQARTALFLPGFRESALRASRAMVGGAAYGRGRPSDGVRLQTNLEFQCLDVATTFSIYGRVDGVKTSRFSSVMYEPCLEAQWHFRSIPFFLYESFLHLFSAEPLLGVFAAPQEAGDNRGTASWLQRPPLHGWQNPGQEPAHR